MRDEGSTVAVDRRRPVSASSRRRRREFVVHSPGGALRQSVRGLRRRPESRRERYVVSIRCFAPPPPPPPPGGGGVRSIAISLSVYMSVCMCTVANI